MGETPRQVHLARLFDEAQGAMGLYTKAFIHFVRNHPELDHIIAQKLPEPLKFEPYTKKTSSLEDIYDQLLYARKDKDLPIKLQQDFDFILFAKKSAVSAKINQVTCDRFNQLLNGFFMTEPRSRDAGIDDKRNFFRVRYAANRAKNDFKKLSNREFSKAAQALYANGHGFINSPRIVIEEGYVTMTQISRWLCMHSKTADDVIDQMRAACLPTIPSPCGHTKITPIEMFGQANNGYVGSSLDGSFPTHINDRPIIRQATRNNANIIHRQFVDLWYDRDLDIGGCPARTLSRRYDGIYMDFARMYMEVMEKVVQYDGHLRQELQCRKNNDEADAFATVTAPKAAL